MPAPLARHLRAGPPLGVPGAIALGLVLLWASPAAAAAEASGLPGLAELPGTIHDTVGRAVGGVEVLMLAPEGQPHRLAAATSDERGRFVLAGLRPGRYRVAAVKSGYRAFVGRVDTAIQRSLELVLRPAEAGTEPASLPREPDWVLRAPRRGVLRELSQVPGGATPAVADPGRTPAVRVDQLFAAAEPGGSPGQTSASETRLRVETGLGEHGRLSVGGTRESAALAPERAAPETPTPARERRQAVRMDLAYDTAPEGRVAMGAFYGRADSDVAASGGGAEDDYVTDRRSWGYSARWLHRDEALGRLDVSLAYRATLLEARGGASPAGSGFASSAVEAAGAWGRRLGPNHDVEIELRAARRDWPLLAAGGLPAGATDPAGRAGDEARWRLRLEASDAWQFDGRASLIGGLGYQRGLGADHSAVVVPSVGAGWATGGVRARGVVSWHDLAEGASSAPALQGRLARGGGALGYDAEVELPLGRRITLRANSRAAPVELVAARRGVARSPGGPSLGEHPWFVSDGLASVRETRVGLSGRRGGTRSWFELAGGSARGNLAVPALLAADALALADGSVTYREARWGVVLGPSGTDVAVEYLALAAEADAARPGSRSREESIELRVAQRLAGLDLESDWRVLVALRLASVEGARVAALEALRQRVSAGLSVAF